MAGVTFCLGCWHFKGSRRYGVGGVGGGGLGDDDLASRMTKRRLKYHHALRSSCRLPVKEPRSSVLPSVTAASSPLCIFRLA